MVDEIVEGVDQMRRIKRVFDAGWFLMKHALIKMSCLDFLTSSEDKLCRIGKLIQRSTKSYFFANSNVYWDKTGCEEETEKLDKSCHPKFSLN